MLGWDLLIFKGVGWMCTQTITLRFSSRWCRALILMQPGLLPATSCPFSVRRCRQRKRDRVETQRGRQRKGLWAEKELEERLRERRADRRKTCVQAVWRLHWHTCYSSAGKKEGVGGKTGGESRRQEYWNCLAACPCPCLATVSLPQWQTYECLAETTEGVLQSHRGWKRHTSVWQMKQG